MGEKIAKEQPSGDMVDLAKVLSQQEWNEIGSVDGDVGATDDFDAMVDQLTSVLAMRLRDLVASRPLTSALFLKDNGDLTEEVRNSLRDYVVTIARMYRNVPYHSLKHATHVTLSANTLLTMMFGPQDTEQGDSSDEDEIVPRTRPRRVTLTHVPRSGVSVEDDDWNKDKCVDEATFGISSDAMLRFALVFSALIHDVDHQGVPNSTLVDEEDDLAIMHNDVSVAEQNSLQLAFSLLAKGEFKVLKKAITPDKIERKKFRQRVIDIVLGTDISNPERLQINQSKWKEAFEPCDETDTTAETVLTSLEDSFVEENFLENVGSFSVNRERRSHSYSDPRQLLRSQSERFGIRQSLDFDGKILDAYSPTSEGEQKLRQHTVLDTLMNAADVAHTMQNFDVFVKWNRRMFREQLEAFKANRIDWDPNLDWYENQTLFFDAYVIPLAEKMTTCGVFGSRSALFLCFAMENKRRWGKEGEGITKQWNKVG